MASEQEVSPLTLQPLRFSAAVIHCASQIVCLTCRPLAYHLHTSSHPVAARLVTRDVQSTRGDGVKLRDAKDTVGNIVMAPWKVIHKHPDPDYLPPASLSDGCIHPHSRVTRA